MQSFLRKRKSGSAINGGPKQKRRKTKVFKKKHKKYRKSTKSSKGSDYVSKKDGISNTVVKVQYKAPKMERFMEALGNIDVYETIATAALNQASGNTQLALTIGTYLTGSEIGTIIGNAFQKMTNVTMRLLDPSLNATTNGVFKIHLKSFDQEIDMLNQAPTSVTVDIYTLVSRNTGSAVYDPVTAWNNISQEAGISTAINSQTPMARPTESMTFNMSWKIVNKSRVELATGEQHNHKFKFNLNRIVDYNYFKNFSLVKGISCGIMMVARGGLGDNENLKIITGANVIQLAPIKVIMATRSKYTYQILQGKPRQHTLVQTMNGTSQPQLYAVDGVSGAVDDLQANINYG